jgi:hypothetical protein
VLYPGTDTLHLHSDSRGHLALLVVGVLHALGFGLIARATSALRVASQFPVSQPTSAPLLDPSALYQHLLDARRDRRLSCSVCGQRYSFDSLNMCRSCGCVYCAQCTAQDGRACPCGGSID